MRIALLSAFLCALAVPAKAQYASSRDGALLASGVLLGTGMAVHYLGHDSVDDAVQKWMWENLRESGAVAEKNFDNTLQYAPLAMDMGLGLLGVPARHSFMDRAVESGIAHVFCGAVSWSSKRLFHTLRPNGKNYESFPSGHSDFVFMNAELVRMEYGPYWGGAAYAMASTVGFMRLYNNWHWLSDVLAGAGLGIVSARVGGWLLEPVKEVIGLPEWNWDGFGTRGANLALLPSTDPVSGAFCMSLSLVF